ncbi:hypothetical protein PWT90_01633 [Aphanocladium album]|nr:hypothetical protein PWT90_01633 [Aphanocladium album]
MDESHRPLTKHRRQLRKGTRSCTECRRRKIRCIFSPGKTVCVHCSLRGCRCIDQRDAGAEFPQPGHDEVQGSANPKTDRNGYRTKGLVDATGGKIEPEFSDVTISLQNASVNPPVISVMGSVTPVTPYTSSAAMRGLSLIDSYQQSARKSLLTILPGREEILSALSENGQWWDSFQKKLGAISRTNGVEPLEAFAVRVMDSGQVTELATLAIGYERSIDDDYSRLPVVERLIFSSFDLLYIGKPKRAWLTWRKGLAAAQLLGLQRLGTDTPLAYQRIWWAIYHGDRFTSLLLGLPHGCGDSTLTKASHRFPGMSSADSWISDLVFDTCIVAGQAIDNNTSANRPSFATTMKLDEQMNSIAASAPCDWWLVDRPVLRQEHRSDQFFDGLIIQFFFLHVRMYLHLPFLTTTTPTEQLLVNSKLCFTIAEKMLRCYITLRTPLKDGMLPFDCKTTDFVGFTAAVVLLVSRRWRAAYQLISAEELASSLALVVEAEAVFQRLHQSKSCIVAGQCCSSLRQLLYSTSCESIVVPYFGVAIMSLTGDALVEVGPTTHNSSALELDPVRTIDFDFAPTRMRPAFPFSGSQENSNCLGMNAGLPEIEALDWDIDADWGAFFDYKL